MMPRFSRRLLSLCRSQGIGSSRPKAVFHHKELNAMYGHSSAAIN
jgi:hypothetical protein